MVTVIVDEYGQDGFLRRISNPHWFRSINTLFNCL